MSKLKNCQRLYGVFGLFGGDQAKKRNKVVVHDEQRLLVLRFRKSGSYTMHPPPRRSVSAAARGRNYAT